ncbi:MAG: methionine--tRNA ligase [Myxococcales bacterium]|nr:methionine--tRNA ligase [Myxococcales bacterium]
MTKRSYFTTPIYYANGRPHIGHAYCSVLTDTFRRYHALFGYETHFLTGTDEHGQKVQKSAENAGVSPAEYVDKMSQAFRDLLPDLHVENDDFIRTTEPRHTEIVREALQSLYDKGDIYQNQYEGWYSERAERFWTEKDLVDQKCPETGGPVERVSEKNYFFRMSKYQPQLIEHLEKNRDWIVPASRWQEVRSFLENPLLDLSISRPKSRLSWGIPLPFDEDFVTYVWFDALLNYCSGIGLYRDDQRFQTWWPHANHFLGKDILTTHSVYWGTMLLALDLPLPKRLVTTGMWLIDNTKMSKSLGNVVDPLSLGDKYGAEVLRYFLMRDIVIGLDASFSEEAVVRRNNSDLANDLGNLLRRTITLVERGFDSKIPAPGPSGDEDAELEQLINAVPRVVEEHIMSHRLHDAIEQTMQVVRAMNRYIDHTAPFKVVKEDPARAGETLRHILEGLHVVANLLHPIMPEKMNELLSNLGCAGPVKTAQELHYGMLEAGTPIKAGPPLFPRLEFEAPPESEAPPKKAEKKAKPTPKPDPGDGMASFDDFLKLQLVTATIVTAEPIEGAEKLLKLTVDAGEESTRTVVAGIAKSYAPDDLPGTSIVLLANLQPRKIFGVLSQGMVLLAESDNRMVFVQPAEALPTGAKIR